MRRETSAAVCILPVHRCWARNLYALFLCFYPLLAVKCMRRTLLPSATGPVAESQANRNCVSANLPDFTVLGLGTGAKKPTVPWRGWRRARKAHRRNTTRRSRSLRLTILFTIVFLVNVSGFSFSRRVWPLCNRRLLGDKVSKRRLSFSLGLANYVPERGTA